MYDSFISDFVCSVDKPLRVLVGKSYDVLATSSDVIHSFSLPWLKVKLDAIPGRINRSVLFVDRVGVFVGYCRELCGAGHSFMPIVLEVVSPGSGIIF